MSLLEIPPLPASLALLPVTRYNVCCAEDWPSRNTLKLLHKFKRRALKPAPKTRKST